MGVGVKREPQSDAAQSIVSGVERSSVRGPKPEFEQLALLIETAAVENRSVAPGDRGIRRWPRGRSNDAGCAGHLTTELHVETSSGHALRIIR
jgi:hypothetical protein